MPLRALVLALVFAGCGETISVGTSAPTYHDGIAPMLAEQCTGCHGEADALPLHDITSVSERRLDVLAALVGGTMPPWGDPDPRCRTLATPAVPTGADVLRFRAWAFGGALEGAPPAAPPEVVEVSTPSVRADMTIEGEAFTPPTRPHTQCYLLDATVTEETRITAARLDTTRPELVRWAELADSPRTLAVLEGLRDGDPDPGWHCPFPDRTVTLNTLVLWPGGEQSVRHPDGTGTVVAPGRHLVLRVHYDVDIAVEATIGLTLEIDAGARAARIVTHEPVRGGMQAIQAGRADATFEATVLQEASMPLTVHAIAPGLAGRRPGRVRIGRAVNGDACIIDVARDALRTWYPFADPFRIESTELLDLRCSYDTRGDVTDVVVGTSDGEVFCGAHFYVTPWMPTDE